MTHGRRHHAAAALLTMLGLVLAAWLMPTPSSAAATELDQARTVTAPLHRLAAAESAGYTRFTDADGIACIDNPAGGMGIHYVNPGLVGDGAVSATAPELLVYAPGPNGRLRLAALEYVVPQAEWDAEHGGVAPQLFGHAFELVTSPNRYGLPSFYELHVWAWEHNPTGMFEDWNPRVTCF